MNAPVRWRECGYNFGVLGKQWLSGLVHSWKVSLKIRNVIKTSYVVNIEERLSLIRLYLSISVDPIHSHSEYLKGFKNSCGYHLYWVGQLLKCFYC